MIRALPIFDLLRHGNAEFAFHKESVRINAVAAELATVEEEYRDPSNRNVIIQPRWIVVTEKEKRPELRMNWSATQEGGR